MRTPKAPTPATRESGGTSSPAPAPLLAQPHTPPSRPRKAFRLTPRAGSPTRVSNLARVRELRAHSCRSRELRKLWSQPKPRIARRDSASKIQTARRDLAPRRRTAAFSERPRRLQAYFASSKTTGRRGLGVGLGRGKGGLGRLCGQRLLGLVLLLRSTVKVDLSCLSWRLLSQEPSAPEIKWRAETVSLQIRITRGHFYKF